MMLLNSAESREPGSAMGGGGPESRPDKRSSKYNFPRVLQLQV